MNPNGYLVLESGETYPGYWGGGPEKAGEVVFNTSHSGYEEVATDPSYFSQIMVFTAPMQGNYGALAEVWESDRVWIEGLVCVSMQNSPRDRQWVDTLLSAGIPVLGGVDTRNLVLRLRDKGTIWGALVERSEVESARKRAKEIIQQRRSELPKDWVHEVSTRRTEDLKGHFPSGPRVAVLDFGCKRNTLRILREQCSEIRVFPSRTSAAEVREWKPDGILLSNGPGDPQDVEVAVEVVKELLGWRFIFGICMGHQILSLALGAKTYKLKYGHRGSNHPIRDHLTHRIYMTSQNHGYVVDGESLPSGVEVTHTNLNDSTVAGIFSAERRCLGVQFHPESHPGPHDSQGLFDFFIRQIK